MTTTTSLIRSTAAEVGPRLRILIRGTTRSTTRRTLLALVAGLLIMTVTVFATTLLAFTRVHRTADTVRTRAAPAIIEVAAARVALERADSAAITSVKNKAVRLSGPGQEFQHQFAIAEQSLTQVAEDNMAGEEGSRTIHFVEGLL